MWIKAVNLDYTSKDRSVKFEIGKVYSLEYGYYFFESAGATGAYFENPLEARYLEIECLSDKPQIVAGDCFNAKSIKIIREIDIVEFKDDWQFCHRYEGYLKQPVRRTGKLMVNLKAEINRLILKVRWKLIKSEKNM